MIMASQAQDVVCTDPVEKEPPAAVQAKASPLTTLPRPITFVFTEVEDHAIFAGEISIRGRSVQLIRALLPEFHAGQRAGRGPAGFPYVKTSHLAKRLGMSEGGLRQLISRLRGNLKVQFERLIRVVPEDDDIIQNHSWRGYRLSPYLSYTAVAEEGRAAPAAAE
jgi:hypothetical protein